jgi:amino acid adenylation domain-containing protein
MTITLPREYEAAAGVPPGAEEEVFAFPLSFAQRRLWVVHQIEPDSPSYNIYSALRLEGALDVVALERSLAEIQRRHESLRTTFTVIRGEPAQVVGPPQPVQLPVLDLSGEPPEKRHRLVEEIAGEEARRPFDLSRGPLVRAQLLRLADDEYVLLCSFHHIIIDSWSSSILRRELAILYAAFCAGAPSPLPEPSCQYADFTLWQRQQLQGPKLDSLLGYWKSRLHELPTLNLPTDRPRPPIPSFRGANRTVTLSRGLTEDLKALGRQERATLFMTVLAAFTTLLHRYTRQVDLVLGTSIANRNRAEIEGLIGFFGNALVLRMGFSGNPSFREALRRVREVCLEAYAHQDCPFEKLVEELQPPRDRSRHPLFQVMVTLNNTDRATSVSLPGLRATALPMRTSTANFDLSLDLHETDQGRLWLALEHSSDLFDDTTNERMLGHLQNVLRAVTRDSDQGVADVPLMTEEEREEVVFHFNQTRSTYPRDRLIHELFAEQAAARPEAVALVCGKDHLTYGELERRARRLSRRLRKAGVCRETLVGLCVERSLEMVVGLLGVLKTGGAYLPLDPTYPSSRLALMLEDARVEVLLASRRQVERLPLSKARVLWLDEDDVVADGSGSAGEPRGDADNLAYVMYTSGSTGRPKGVAVTHRGVVRLVKETGYARFGPGEVFLQLAPIAFDASTFEIWGCLLNGGRLVLMPPQLPSLEELEQAIRRYQVTTLWLTAGLFHLMVDKRLGGLRPLRQLLAGGDVLSVSHAVRFLQTEGHGTLINGYGPTESTTFACCHPLTAADQVGTSVPIGRPIANTRVYVLDRRLAPVPVGVPGELFLTGDGLARGYVHHPELTAKAFLPDPFTDEPGARLYRTGDLVRFRPDGTLEFLGRVDHQVKVRGFRIEPEEIEAVLARHPAVRQVVVLARRSPDGDRRLVAYIVPAGSGELPSPSQWRLFLADRLPAYLVPSLFVTIPSLPLTPEGKIDRQAMPESEQVPSNQAELVAPRNPLESQLVQIWEELLGVRPVGVRHSFFELGGHSLLAVRLFNEIETRWHKHLPLATLFRNPTVEGLARALDAGDGPVHGASVVPIRATGSRPPFFLVHAIDGDVFCFRELADHLGLEQPVYGLRARGLEDDQEPQTRVEEMAAHYLDEIRRLQPEGPYYLGGFSSGALIAYEMAQQLHARRQSVGLLAVFDRLPGHSFRGLDSACWKSNFRNLARNAIIWVDDFLRAGRQEQWTRIYGRLRALWKALAGLVAGGGTLDPQTAVMVEDWLSLVPEHRQAARRRFFEVHSRAYFDYAPRPYPGRVTLFWARRRQLLSFDDPYRAAKCWPVEKVDIRVISGSHRSMLQAPHVQTLAAELMACLEAARREVGEEGVR